MSRSLRRGVLAASLVLATASLSACAAGNDAASLGIKPDNPETSVGGIKIQSGVVIVSEGEDQPVAVTASVVNNTTTSQTLESVTIKGLSTPLELAGPKGESGITVPAGGTVRIGGKDGASATLPDASDEMSEALGRFRTVTFAFSEAGDVPLEASVVPDEDFYTPWAATPSPSATPSSTAEQAGETPPAGAEGNEGAEDGEPADAETEAGGESSADAGKASNTPPASPNASQSAKAGDEAESGH